MNRDALVIRPMHPSERNLVVQSWLRSSARSKFAALMPKLQYEAEEHALIEDMLANPANIVLVAELAEVPGEVHGWLAHDETAVHYVYVKQLYRRQGIASRLFDAAVESTALGFNTCSHTTRSSALVPWLASLVYNPFYAFKYIAKDST